MRVLFENGGFNIIHTNLPSANEFDVLMYLCHVSYCLVLGYEIDIEKTDIETIKNRILYQLSLVVSS